MADHDIVPLSVDDEPPCPSFYDIYLGSEHYEVEAYSEQHAFQRALAHYTEAQAKLGNTVIAKLVNECE